MPQIVAVPHRPSVPFLRPKKRQRSLLAELIYSFHMAEPGHDPGVVWAWSLASPNTQCANTKPTRKKTAIGAPSAE